MRVYYTTKKKPLSHNNCGKKEAHKKQFRDEFNKKYKALYDDLPIEGKELRSAIYYLHKLPSGVFPPDVDNLSKPIVDSFNDVIYKDDSQIISRRASIMKLDDYDIMTFDATDVPKKVADDFLKYCKNKEEHIVFFAIDEMKPELIKVGEL